MMNFFRRIPWKSILLFVLVSALAIGAVVGIASSVTKKTKTISSFLFARGAIDEDGIYVESDTSIYTKDYIECQGLLVEPDFEATGTYQVFYYGEYKSFIGATEVMNATDGYYDRGDAFPAAKYCRIVITPDVPKDEDGKVEEDWKIPFYGVLGYADTFTITVDKKQSFVAPNLFETGLNLKNVSAAVDPETNMFKETTSAGYNYVTIDCERINSFKVVFEEAADSYSFFFFDASSKSLFVDRFVGEKEFVFDVFDNAKLLCINYKAENPPAIYPIS